MLYFRFSILSAITHTTYCMSFTQAANIMLHSIPLSALYQEFFQILEGYKHYIPALFYRKSFKQLLCLLCQLLCTFLLWNDLLKKQNDFLTKLKISFNFYEVYYLEKLKSLKSCIYERKLYYLGQMKSTQFVHGFMHAFV